MAGRAGRRKSQGKVVIQTRRPDNPIFSKIIQGDYQQFYLEEMADRQRFFYPPFVKLIKITVKHKEAFLADKAARHLTNLINAISVKKIVLGPEKGLVAKVKNQYLYEILVKVEKQGNAQALFKRDLTCKIDEVQAHKDLKGVRVVVDVDPY